MKNCENTGGNVKNYKENVKILKIYEKQEEGSELQVFFKWKNSVRKR